MILKGQLQAKRLGECKTLLACLLLFLFCFSIEAQTPLVLQVDLTYFGANPATNRQVQWQQVSPFQGNFNYAESDPVNGQIFITNPPAGPSMAVLFPLNFVIQSPPGQRIQFQVTMLPGDAGTIDASNRLTSPSPTFPAGLVSWAVATSETRYALSTNQAGAYGTLAQITNIAVATANLVGQNGTNNLNSTNALYQLVFNALGTLATNLANARQAGSFTLTNLAITGAFTNVLSAGQNTTLSTNAGVVSVNATNQTFLTNTMTGIVFQSPNAYQPATAALTNLSGTGAFTNGFGAGLNVTVTTNAGQVLVNANSQTNGFTSIVSSNPAAYYQNSNPSNFIQSTAVPATLTNGFYPLSNPSNFIQSANVPASLTNQFYPSSNPQGFIPSVNTPSWLTNGLLPGQNISFMTNGNVLTVSATNQTFLTNNCVQSGFTNALLSQGQATLLYYPTSNPSGFISGAITNAFLPTNTAALLYYPTSNPSQFITGLSTNGLASLVVVTNLINIAGFNSTNNDTYNFLVLSNVTYGIGLANSNNEIRLYGVATNYANTNAAAQIAAIPVRTNYIASTNGIAYGALIIANALVLNSKTNFLGSTNVIGVVGNFGGTYERAPYGTIFTNFSNSAYTIIYSLGNFYLQSNTVTMYSWGPPLGLGTIVLGPSPAPYASFGGYRGEDGIVIHGIIDSTNLLYLLQQAVGVPVVAGIGLTNSVASGTNTVSLNTNFVVQLIIANSVGPTNGVGTNFVESYVSQFNLTNQFFAAPAITNVLYTNVTSLEPVISGNTVFIETNSGGGGTTANAYLTNGVNADAFPSLTNVTTTISISNVTASTIVNSPNFGVGGTPYLNFSGQHYVLDSPGSVLTTFGGDTGTGIIGGTSNQIATVIGQFYGGFIFGGFSNALQNGSGGAWVNSGIENSFLSHIYSFSGAVTNLEIINSYYSGISNQPGGTLFNDGIINGVYSYIGQNSSSGSGVYSNDFALGPDVGITNSDVIAINASPSTPITSTTNDEILLSAANGVFINGSLITPGIPYLNGSGTNTTLNSAVSVVVTNLGVLGTSYLDASNLTAVWTAPPSQQTGTYPQGLVPIMTWSNLPSGLAWASGNFLGTSQANSVSNAWGFFTTNSVTVTTWGTPGMSNTVTYTFPSNVTVSGDGISFGDADQGFAQALFQVSYDDVNWTTLGQTQLQCSLSGNAMTNFFAPVVSRYFRWSFTNQLGTFQVFGAGNSALDPPAQIYGPPYVPPTANNGMNVVSSPGPSIYYNAPNGIGFGMTNVYPYQLSINGGVFAGSVAAPNASLGALDVSSLTLNGNPVSLSISSLISVYATNFFDARQDGIYTGNGVPGFLTNSVGAVFVNMTNFPSGQAYNGVYSSGPTWLATTNWNTFIAGSFYSTNYPPSYYVAGSSPLGKWVPTTHISGISGASPSFFFATSPLLNGTPPITTAYVVTSVVNPLTTVSSVNSSITVVPSTNNGVVNYDLSVGAGQSVYFIVNQSATLPIATRPAICYDTLGGEFFKTNSTTDNSGWLQIISDQ
jgi:hypothetical protein